ncbi:MAG TPA: 2-C-methyl-D-erythritol 2,4-cyclodiphosphate synthase [Bacteroidales bacterium]|nr:2-C-methyl-D-erythritol 2,4-cyclodiphosphate synthase [Bacteroidales bacterium]
MSQRIGFGYDVHRLATGRQFWLGGVLIPSEFGAEGHSDADVLLHAICDALLGAAALGDIGKHFPDTDPALKGIDSKILLGKVNDLMTAGGYSIVNIDSTIALQAPKVAAFIENMRKTISGILGISINQVSVKATTTEKLGFEGRGEGVSAYAVVLINMQ